jgi:type II secretory pathway pseudopilin PulG
MVILGILTALATPAWRSYQANQEDISASREVVSVLRNAQVRATSEATTYRVDVNSPAKTLTVFRYNGTTPVRRQVVRLEGQRVRLHEVTFPAPSTTSVFFYPRGNASPGTIVLKRSDREVRKTITVEGLTGRVSTT